MLSSCAYMQTHKNIEEQFHSYKGSELSANNISLHQKGGQWYLSAPEGIYNKRYPIIHDDIFDKHENDPTYTLIENSDNRRYFPITTGTATCLQRTDGYAQTNALVTEILNTGKPAVDNLKGASTHAIRAEIVEGKQPAMLIAERTPQETPGLIRAVSTLDMCTVDLLGSAAYNVAIPFMAPFRFFSEFLSEY